MGNYRRNFVTGFKKLATGLLVAGLFCVFFNTLQTQQARAVTTTPTKMNFQGRLADASGITMPNGTYNMRLKLYTVLSGGSAVWTQKIALFLAVRALV